MLTPSKYIKGYCLVTGASHGIGKAICYEWASRGVSIVAVAIDSLALKETKEDIESTHKVSYLTLTKDLLDVDAPKEILDWCVENNIDVQVLINNVGISDGCSKIQH